MILELASPHWSRLHHASGTAEDVPRLIEHLPMVDDSQQRELWIGLWHLLWRNGVAFPASIAAVPHLVSFAESVDVAERAVALHLVGAIVTSPVRGEVAAELQAGCDAAVARVPALVAGSLAVSWEPDVAQVMCALLAAGKGHRPLAGAVLALEPVADCSTCGGSHPTAGWTAGALAASQRTGERP